MAAVQAPPSTKTQETPQSTDSSPRRKGGRYALIYSYDDDETWKAVVPESEVEAYLPAACRSVPDYRHYKALGAMILALIVSSMAYLAAVVTNFISPFLPFVAIPFVALPPSLIIGAWMGWQAGHLIGPLVIYRVRRVWLDPSNEQDQALIRDIVMVDHPAFYHERDGLRRYAIPFHKTFLLEDESPLSILLASPPLEAVNGSTNGNGHNGHRPQIPPPPPVFLASHAFKIMQAYDVQSRFRATMPKARKLQIATAVTLSICIAVVFLFTVIIMTGSS